MRIPSMVDSLIVRPYIRLRTRITGKLLNIDAVATVTRTAEALEVGVRQVLDEPAEPSCELTHVARRYQQSVLAILNQPGDAGDARGVGGRPRPAGEVPAGVRLEAVEGGYGKRWRDLRAA